MPDMSPSLDRAGSALPADRVHHVTAAIDSSRDELIALVQELVRIPSKNPKLTGVADGGEARVQAAAVLAEPGHLAHTTGCVAVSEIAWFAEAGIPAVIFGPGPGLGVHTSDGPIEIEALVEGKKALALSMIAWCEVDEVA